MSTQTKRYLITYSDSTISTESIPNVLGMSKAKCLDGVEVFASESLPGIHDILHFQDLGISTIELSAEEAKKLSKRDGILAVEEDVEMFAINETINDDVQFQEYFNSSELLVEELVEENHTLYNSGYDAALLDVFKSLLKNKSNKSSYDDLLTKIKPNESSVQTQPTPWNINLVKAPGAWARGIRGTGIKVAILDTGIRAHPDLHIAGGVGFIPGSVSFNDNHGHGTHCAGVVGARNNLFGVVGVAPNASLYAVKVLNDQGSGMMSWIIAGMQWCVTNRMKVASMSLGGPNVPSVAYANAVKNCQDNGVTVVVASGNSYGSNFPWVCSPANSITVNVPNASPIAVGAVNIQSQIAPFSSQGAQSSPWNHVLCVAPGVNVNSTYLNNGYISMNGTSMACPHVAGLVALINQRYPGITPFNVKKRIAQTCTDLGPAGYDQTFGYGLINCNTATL